MARNIQLLLYEFVLQPSFIFTKDTSGDSTQLVYLRARWYNPADGRFQSRDTWEGKRNSPLTLNKWNYTLSNPVNYSDPTGRYSAIQIAESYDITVLELVEALKEGKKIPALQDKWGWIMALLDARDGQSITIGADAMNIPFLSKHPMETIGLNNSRITIGAKSLPTYTSEFLGKPMSPALWWRDTSPNHYILDSIEYFDNPYDLPDFRTLSIDALMLLPIKYPHPITLAISELFDVGGAFTIDSYGNFYLTVFGAFAPGLGLGVSAGEGYINYKPENLKSVFTPPSTRPLPSEEEIHNTLTELCFNGGVTSVGTVGQGSVCGGGSTAFLYGYEAELIGGTIGPSWTFEPIFKIPELGWNYISRTPGVSSDEVLKRIALDLMTNCP